MLVAALELPASHGSCHIRVSPQVKLLIDLGFGGEPLLFETISPIMFFCRLDAPVLNGSANIRILREIPFRIDSHLRSLVRVERRVLPAVDLAVSIAGPGRRPCGRPYRALPDAEGARGRPGTLGHADVGLEYQHEASDPDIQSEDQFSNIFHDNTLPSTAQLSAQND